MPLEYAGGGRAQGARRRPRGRRRVRRQPPRQRCACAEPAPRSYVDACLTNGLAGSSPGQAQYTLACDDATGGVVDDMIVYLHRPGRRAAGPERRQHRRGGAPAAGAGPRTASSSSIGTPTRRCSPCRAARRRALLEAVGLPAEHPYMSFVTAEHAGTLRSSSAAPGYTGERGYELLLAAEGAGRAVGRAARGRRAARRTAPAGSAPATPCAPRWATRCTARTSARTSPRCRPAPAGRSAGTSPRSGAASGCWPSASSGRTGVLRGLRAAGRGIPRPHMTVVRRDGARPVSRSARSRRGPSRRRCAPASAWPCSTPRRRDGDEVAVEVRGRQEAFTVTQPAVRADRRARLSCAQCASARA